MIDRQNYPELKFEIEQFKQMVQENYDLECEMDFYKLHGGQQDETMEKKTYTGRTKPY